MRPGIPALGFFFAAQALGVFTYDPTGPEARAYQPLSCSVSLHSIEASPHFSPRRSVSSSVLNEESAAPGTCAGQRLALPGFNSDVGRRDA